MIYRPMATFYVVQVAHALAEDLFARMREGEMYVDATHARWLCPCGCRIPVVVELHCCDESTSQWRLMVYDNKPTLHPQVTQLGYECKSQYWIKSGTVEWINDD